MSLRADLTVIADLINPGARMLDLGCGEGELLAHLQTQKHVNGYGLDVDAENIRICLDKGVNVIEQDVPNGKTPVPVPAAPAGVEEQAAQEELGHLLHQVQAQTGAFAPAVRAGQGIEALGDPC